MSSKNMILLFHFLLTISNNVLSNQVIQATHFNVFLGLILSCNLKWMPYKRVENSIFIRVQKFT